MEQPGHSKFTLGRKITIWILFISGIFTLFVSAIQLYTDFKSGVKTIDRTLSIIEKSHINSLKNDIWFMLEPNIKTQIKEIFELPYIDHVDLQVKGMDNIIIGELPEPKFQKQNIYTLEREHDGGEISRIGVLTITASLEQVYANLTNKILIILISQAVKTFCVTFFILFLIHTLITRHIHQISKYIDTITSDTKSKPASLKLERFRSIPDSGKSDELDLLANAINTMQKDLQISLSDLKTANSYISSIIDSMPSILIGLNLENRINLWNNTAQQTTEITVKNAKGQPVIKIFPRISMIMEQIKEVMETGKEKTDLKYSFLYHGETRYDSATIYPILANKIQEGVVIRIDDITEHVRLEQVMLQNEKMLSVGGLAAGMAHEINNPLAGMMQSANVVKNRLGKEINIPANRKAAFAAGTTIEAIHNFMKLRDIPRMLSTIKESGQRIAQIVENMLSFAHKNDTRFSLYSLADIIDKTLELADSDYNVKHNYDFKTIKIRKAYEDDLPLVPCENSKIQQVLLNILNNGAQAMQEAKTQNPMFIFRISIKNKTKMICLEIENNGPGINKKICNRVFEPFFTTKPVGEGTGLGLSISYFIITENHGGKMDVTSTSDSGTKFIIQLPLEDSQVC
jgi:PAS domain S-box-containing protein